MGKSEEKEIRVREIETDKSLATYGLYKFDENDPETYILARDVVFGVAVSGNTPMVQHIIDCVLGKGRFKVIKPVNQAFDRQSPNGKGVALDVLAEDEEGRRFDVEIQIVKEGNILKRAREYQSHIDAMQLRRGGKARELKDTYVIFITAYDPFGFGLNLYTETRHLGEVGYPIDNGSHCLYVNAFDPKQGTPLGELCEDLFCQKEANIHSALLKEALQYCRSKRGRRRISMRMNQTEYEVTQRVTKEVTEKVTEEVTEKVTEEVTEKVTETVTKEVREMDREDFVRSLLEEGGYSDERIAKLVRIPLQEAIRIRRKIESEGN